MMNVFDYFKNLNLSIMNTSWTSVFYQPAHIHFIMFVLKKTLFDYTNAPEYLLHADNKLELADDSDISVYIHQGFKMHQAQRFKVFSQQDIEELIEHLKMIGSLTHISPNFHIKFLLIHPDTSDVIAYKSSKLDAQGLIIGPDIFNIEYSDEKKRTLMMRALFCSMLNSDMLGLYSFREFTQTLIINMALFGMALNHLITKHFILKVKENQSTDNTIYLSIIMVAFLLRIITHIVIHEYHSIATQQMYQFFPQNRLMDIEPEQPEEIIREPHWICGKLVKNLIGHRI